MHAKKHLGSRSPLSRKAQNISPLPRILIVCEGEKTEPNYFKSFRIHSADVCIHGTGRNTSSLVDYTIRQISSAKKERNPYDEVWVVFDKDSFPVENINLAFEKAKNSNIHPIFSNEAFEIWYILHFEYRQSGLTRNFYGNTLTNHLGRRYEKNLLEMYSYLQSKTQDAIRNARNLRGTYAHTVPLHQRNPFTTVDILVERLLQLQKT